MKFFLRQQVASWFRDKLREANLSSDLRGDVPKFDFDRVLDPRLLEIIWQAEIRFRLTEQIPDEYLEVANLPTLGDVVDLIVLRRAGQVQDKPKRLAVV